MRGDEEFGRFERCRCRRTSAIDGNDEQGHFQAMFSVGFSFQDGLSTSEHFAGVQHKCATDSRLLAAFSVLKQILHAKIDLENISGEVLAAPRGAG